MERRELRHDRRTVSLLTDHMAFLPKYGGKIPVEKTIALAVEGIIRKICKEMKIEIIDMTVKNQEKTNVKTLCAGIDLSPGFSDCNTRSPHVRMGERSGIKLFISEK